MGNLIDDDDEAVVRHWVRRAEREVNGEPTGVNTGVHGVEEDILLEIGEV